MKTLNRSDENTTIRTGKAQRATQKAAACVILAAGEGKRMKSRIPKVLHRLAGKPLIQHVVDVAKDAGAGKILVVVSRDHQELKALLGNSAAFVVQKDRLGTGHALAQAQKLLRSFSGDVLVLCGDAPLIRAQTVRALLAQHRQTGSVCTVLTAKVEDPRDYGRIVRGGAGNIVRIVEEKMADSAQKAIREINSGAYCLKVPDVFDALEKIERRGPSGEYPLTDIVDILVGQDKSVGGFISEDSEEIIGINSRGALAQAEKILQKRIMDFHMDNGVSIVDPENTYIAAEVCIGQDSVIEPFSVIEGKVRIGQNCVVGPFAHLRDGTVLGDGSEVGNFVEVKKSTIGSLSKAKHLSYLGDASVGSKVNIGAGTITANYDGKHKHPTHIGDEASIGSNTTLVAPVSVGKRAVTGAGSVILAGRDVAPGSVVVGVPARVLKSRRAALTLPSPRGRGMKGMERERGMHFQSRKK